MQLILLFILISQGNAGLKYNKATEIQNPLKAVEYYRQIINEYPNSVYADSSIFRIGMFYYLIGDYEQTIDALEIIYRRGETNSLYSKSCLFLKICYNITGDSTNLLKFTRIVEEIEESNKKLPPENEVINDEKNSDDMHFYSIQLGAYRDKEWSNLFIERLKESEIKSFTIEHGEYIKIYSGKFNTEFAAEIYLTELKNKGFDGFIVEF